MAEFRNYNAINPEEKQVKITIVSGPVIIEEGKVLLDKHGEDTFWKFPGGAQKDDLSGEENARQEAKRELGLEIKIASEPKVLVLEREKEGAKEYVVLIHYLAKRKNKKITPAEDVREYAWHKVNYLPRDCAPNIEPVVKYFQRQYERRGQSPRKRDWEALSDKGLQLIY